MLRHKTFNSRTGSFFPSVKWTNRPERAVYTGIEKIEFVVPYRRASGPFREYWQPEAEQQILKYRQISLHSLPFDFTFTSYIAEVKDLPVREAD